MFVAKEPKLHNKEQTDFFTFVQVNWEVMQQVMLAWNGTSDQSASQKLEEQD